MSKFESKDINPCRCGFQPTHYSVYYGRTPYDIGCPVCKKQTTMAKCKVTGWHGHVIDYWNEHISKLTQEELEEEVKLFNIERQENTGYDGYKYYDYYWEKDKGETLYARA